MPDEAKVGYGAPPISTRFQKGQSGNPAGRPKGSLGFRTALRRACEANGVTPSAFMTDSLADEIRKAQAGDEKARDRVLRWLEKYFPDDSGEME